MVDLPVLALGRGPRLPAVGLIQDERVLLRFERGFRGLILFEPVEVLQEQQPRGLLRVVELAGAAGILPEDVVDVLEGLFKHGEAVDGRSSEGDSPMACKETRSDFPPPRDPDDQRFPRRKISEKLTPKLLAAFSAAGSPAEALA